MSTEDLQVWSRTPDRTKAGILPVLAASVVFRETGVHTFVFTLDGNDPRSDLAQKGTGVLVSDRDGMLFSGWIMGIEVARQNGESSVVISGMSDMHALADRTVYPDYTRGFDQQTTQTHRTHVAVAETVIVDLINQNAGPANPFSVRRYPGLLNAVSLGRGTEVRLRARWSSLLEEVQTMAMLGGLVVDIQQDPDSTDIHTLIRTTRDLSRVVRFMDGAGLGDYSFKTEAETANTVIVLGQGEGTSRKVWGLTRPTVDQWFEGRRRIETIKERSDTTDTNEFRKTYDETILETAQSASAEFDVTETAHHRFGVDYLVGDIVGVVLPGGYEIVDKVRAAEVDWNEHSRDVKLTVGNYSTTAEIDVDVARIREIQKHIRRQETK